MISRGNNSPRRIGRLGRAFTLRELAAGVVVFDIISAIVTGLEWLFGQIVDIATTIASVLVLVWNAISPIFSHVWGALKGVWSSVLRPFFGKVEKWFTQLRAWWDRWAKPVTNLLQKIIKYERLIYDATIGPILATISTLQKLLVLLHLDRTKIGAKLAKALGTAYNDLNGIWQLLTQKLNEVINAIQRVILNVDGLLRVDLMVKSVYQSFKSRWSVWGYKTLRQLSPQGRELLEAFRLQPTIAEHRQAFISTTSGAGGPWDDAIAHGREIFDIVVKGDTPRDALDDVGELT